MTDVPDKVAVKKPKKAEKTSLSIVEKNSLQTLLEKINSQYAVILRGSQVLIMRHWMGEDGNGKLIFLNKRDFLLLQENNKLWVKDDAGNSKPVKVGQAWLEWKDRQQYEEIYFEPCGKEYRSRYNLWRGFAIEPIACDDTSKFSLFLKHIHDNICQADNECYDWVLAWLADLFQKPARKIGTALVLRGPMRIGKGAFALHIGKLLGIHYMPITQSSQLTGKFNGHMADKLLMFVDEGWWSDEKYGQGVLRALITEMQVTIEMKNRDAVTLPNFTRFLIAANADWVVPLGMGDENRFVILDVGVAEQRNSAYFAAIQNQMDSGGYEAFLHYLLNYKYNENIPRNVIKTDAMCENKIYSMTDEFKWWHECLHKEKVGDFKLNDRPDNDIPCENFYGNYQKWCDAMKIRPITSNILPKKLKLAVEFNRTKKLTMDGFEYYYFLQSLSDLRVNFERFLGHKINWEGI